MTRRERLRRCYFHEELDRPAVYCRTGFPENDPTYDELRAYLKIHSELKQAWCPETLLEAASDAEARIEPYSQDFERHVTVLHTPQGDLYSSHLMSLKGQPGLRETHLLKTREDAEAYLSLPLPEVEGDVSSFFAADAEMGDAGITTVELGLNPGGFAVELFGSERFAILSVTDRDIIHALCERRMTIVQNLVRFLLRHNIGPYFGMAGQEYIVPPLHGPRDFLDFNVKYDKPIIGLMHDAGGRVHIHSHGSIKAVFQGFLDMGADVLHPFEAPPMGDITAAEAKALARGTLCLEGNIQISRMYEAPAEAVRQETEALIRDTFDDRKGLVVCPTASPYIRGQGARCYPRFKAMVDAVLAAH